MSRRDKLSWKIFSKSGKIVELTKKQVIQLFLFCLAKLFGIMAVISIFTQQIMLAWILVVLDFVIVTSLIYSILKSSDEELVILGMKLK